MQRHTFIVRLVRDEDGALRGQLIEPVSGRQTLFTDAAALWVALLRELDGPPAPLPPPAAEPEDPKEFQNL
jgi:hypothetical protein